MTDWQCLTQSGPLVIPLVALLSILCSLSLPLEIRIIHKQTSLVLAPKEQSILGSFPSEWKNQKRQIYQYCA